MTRDLLSGLVLLAIAALYHWATGAIADSTLSDEVGASGLPRALAYALAGLGLLLIVRSLALGRFPGTWVRSAAGHRAKRGADSPRAETAPASPPVETEPGPTADEEARLPRAVGLLLFGAVYVAVLPALGYLVSVALLIAAIALYEGASRRWTVPAAAIGGAVLYWLVFVKLLGVRQPTGALWQGLFS